MIPVWGVGREALPSESVFRLNLLPTNVNRNDTLEGSEQVATKQSVDLSELKLDDAHAKAILEAAIEAEAYNEDMPKNRKDRINAAAEQIGMMCDAYINEDVTPDNDDDELAAMGEQIEEILELAGITIEDGEVEFGDLPDLDGDEDGDDDDDDNGDDDGDEAAVDINDIISGYEDLSAAARVKKIKALDLDPEDDDDYNTARDIADWENEQDKPSSRVLSWLEENGFAEEEGDGEGDEDDDDDNDGDDNGGDGDEPWDGYDKSSAADIRKVLDTEFKAGNLTAENVQYVRDYEDEREKPPTRKNVLKKCDELLAKFEAGEAPGASGDDDDEDEAPARSRRGRRGAKSNDTEDEKPKSGRSSWGAKKGGGSSDGGTLTLTREQILEALENGSVEIEVG
jgi:hypothetical protein